MPSEEFDTYLAELVGQLKIIRGYLKTDFPVYFDSSKRTDTLVIELLDELKKKLELADVVTTIKRVERELREKLASEEFISSVVDDPFKREKT